MSHVLKENGSSSLQHSGVEDGRSKKSKIRRSRRSKIRRSRRSKVRRSRSKKSRRSKVGKSKVGRSKVRRSKRSRKSKIRRSKRSKVRRSKRSKVRRSKRSKVRRSKRSKLYKITDLDKLGYRLNKFPGLAKDIFNFLSTKELRAFLNNETFDNLYNRYHEQINFIRNLRTECQNRINEVKQDCKNRIKDVGKEIDLLEKSFYVVERYILYGELPRNYKKKYPFLKVIKEE